MTTTRKLPTWSSRSESPMSERARLARESGDVGPDPYDTVLERLREGGLQQIRPDDLHHPTAETRSQVRQLIESELTRYQDEARAQRWSPVDDPAELIRRIEAILLGMGPLQPLMDDSEVEEIICNGPQNVFVIRAGDLKTRYPQFFFDVPGGATAADQLTAFVNHLAADNYRQVNLTTPIMDATLPDGSRVNIVIHPLVRPSPAVTIRRFRVVARTLDDLVSLGTISSFAALFLRTAIAAGLNILVCGSTASGKTNFLNALCSVVPVNDRVITIEDTLELQIPGNDVVNLVSRAARLDGTGGITQTHLLANAMRQRPDRIIMGEARDGAAFEMLVAANTGHEGILATVHANNSAQALSRLEILSSMHHSTDNLNQYTLRTLIAASFHIVVFLERLPGGRRVVREILEVTGALEGQNVIQKQLLYQAQPDGQNLRRTDYAPQKRLREHLERKGIDPHQFAR
ncbi:MAG: Flp pilus assembly complex ATPase component TadA [Chloroflexi bacterium]|nr:Flp pilus assembly complex ATPase component TadA [Chloroflexota bacterium]MBU1748332.1 Flp pilus assembly complex ATPase component TadA [Chloroflexota bacterium]